MPSANKNVLLVTSWACPGILNSDVVACFDLYFRHRQPPFLIFQRRIPHHKLPHILNHMPVTTIAHHIP
ncbi:hypothetical protein BC829DRAFT_389865, partial [Chytridium lagenaria]